MKLRVIWTGKTRNRNLAGVLDDYAKRIGRLFAGLDIVELREVRTKDDTRRIADDSDRILSRLKGSDYVIALDDTGRLQSSDEFARLIADRMSNGRGDLVFVVGGPAGMSATLRQRSDLQVSLSRFTFSHDLARAALLEQIYRALTIICNHPYAR